MAFDVLSSVCVDGDLRTVWPLYDPDFRTALAEQWVRDNDRHLHAVGEDGDTVASALAEAEPDHPLWMHFERVHEGGELDPQGFDETDWQQRHGCSG
ncbi:hypothetical protein M1M07_21140 [Rhodococcus sp. HM1]|uniref:hypothetical protein n=1 Tax=Rhodococcus sp. HM1 TaxID=2937759 RepID=UPI00200B2DEA|nr:hypothetical protein [Rhodococcus sp. HM1]MCK8673600.1 hypothetical protein [Rhodococcus sp. HM1]